MIFQCMMVVDKYDASPAIRAARDRGAFVVSDRWWQSAYCYGAADGLPRDWLFRAHQQLPQPDLSVLIDITAEEARRRTLARGRRDRYEDAPALQERVQVTYQALWAQNTMRQYPDVPDSWRVVDGMGTEEEVHERVWQQVVAYQERRFQR
jgi:thymidylate kinase